MKKETQTEKKSQTEKKPQTENQLFVKCECCGKHIVIGKDEYFKRRGYCAIFCSLECYTEAYETEIQHGTMSLEEADNSLCSVYEDHPYTTKLVEVKEGGPRKLSPIEVDSLLLFSDDKK